jgi:hypothetical protein
MVVSDEFDDGCDMKDEGNKFVSDGHERHFSSLSLRINV